MESHAHWSIAESLSSKTGGLSTGTTARSTKDSTAIILEVKDAQVSEPVTLESHTTLDTYDSNHMHTRYSLYI